MIEKRLRTRKVRRISMWFVCEYRVSRQTHFLRPFDLAIPVRTFDQSHHKAQLVPPGNVSDDMDQLQRARLIGLYRQPKTLPVRKLQSNTLRQRLKYLQ